MSTHTKVKLQCPRCQRAETFEYTPNEPDQEQSDIRSLLDEWPWDSSGEDGFNPQRVAYRQRVRRSAQTLIGPNDPIPKSLHVCWHCIARGDLNEALNEITLGGLYQRLAYDEAVKRFDDVSEAATSDHALLEMEAAIQQELSMTEQLDAEFHEVELQLKAAMDENTKLEKSALMLKNGLSMTRNAIESLESKITMVEERLKAVPETIYNVWADFFPIKDNVTFASICGIPLAYQGGGQWHAAQADVQNISAAMILVSCLVGRLTNTLPHPLSDFIVNRPYRILTTPTSVETRRSNPRIHYPLVPFVNDKTGENWFKGLRLLSDSVALLFRHWKVQPPHPLPESGTEDRYYVLDLAKPNQWNEKMRFLLLNIEKLIALRFIPVGINQEAS